MKLTDIFLNEENPRTIRDEKFNQLLRSILKFPKMLELRQIVIDKSNVTLGGNMRLRVVMEIANRGKDWLKEQLKELDKEENLSYFEPLFKGVIPDKWVKKAEDLSPEEREAFIIEDNVSFGEWDFDLLIKDFTPENLLDFGVDLPDFILNPPTPTSKTSLQLYTTKIKSPIYEPKNAKPTVDSMVDTTKERSLAERIQAADISKADKDFLLLAATRHIVFNYEKIADYYAHSSKEVQELMEESALIIIDFNKAIELGYVKLTKELCNLFKKEEDEK